jgi:hypothetical protein
MNVTLRRFDVESDSQAVGSKALLPGAHCSFVTVFTGIFREIEAGASMFG